MPTKNQVDGWNCWNDEKNGTYGTELEGQSKLVTEDY